MTTTDVAGPAFWKQYWQRQPTPQTPWTAPWLALLEQHLPTGPAFRALEVGCVPGRIMRAIHDRLGYRVHGIDYSEIADQLADDLERQGLSHLTVERADLRTYQPDELFDLVYSMGVIEHFSDYSHMVDHHCRLVRPGGYVHITMPNFRGLQYWLRRWMCPQALLGHHLRAMSARRLRRRLQANGLNIVYCDGWGTFDFWFPPGIDVHPKVGRYATWYTHRVKQLLTRLKLDRVPTWWSSPYIVSLARKPR
ncbi:MAG: class I SAM-dependent methyltransferase [Phycisphaerae bacterium]